MNHLFNVNQFHREAMEYADLAFLAKRRGNLEEAQQLFRRAFELESEAAHLVADNFFDEPSRSVLHRSAATLALDCGEIREAERLIAVALAGNPPDEIADELRDLLEEVNFNRHLELQGITLNRREVQLSFAGGAVGLGIALSDVVIQRISDLQKLIHRTAERLKGKKLREGGGTPKALINAYSVYITAPRKGSFTLTLQIGGQPDQLLLPGFENLDNTDRVIDEVIECLTLVNADLYDTLKEKIPDVAYYRNFVGLAKKIAPDGEKVSLVGLTTVRGNETMKLSLTKAQDEIQIIPEIEASDDEQNGIPVSISGYLRLADAIQERSQIKLVDDKGKKHTIIVPEGLMNDIVKPLWDEYVLVKGMRIKGGKIQLQDIQPVQ